MWHKLVSYLLSYTDNMSKGYKKEYIEKVKAKFNDLQSNGKLHSASIGKSSNDKPSEVCNTDRVVKQR